MADNIVKWGTYEADTAEQEQKQLDEGGGLFSFKEGKNVIRILPPPLGKTSPFKVVWQHALNLPDGNFKSFTCLAREGKKACPLCNKAEKLKATGNPVDFAKAKDWFPRRRIFANIIDREAPEAGPQVVVFGKTVHEALIALRTDPDAGGDFTHPETGFDIIIERKGKGKNDTEYKVFAARRSSSLGNFEFINMQKDLDQFAKMLTAEEIIAVFKAAASGGQSAPSQPTQAAPAQSASPPSAAEPEYREVAPRGGEKVVSGTVTQRRTVEQDTHNAPPPLDDAPF